ncbi:hypothetical protein [Methylomonas sp. ZR1]|uniref:hypothetical protein n=1 Tax=Methylomonas sp. ZR1 TaxID=1797072 RepID=UPI001491BCE7|nr:hypothetical protein [Methylomonas sp. ZR1]NOV31219.1 hypothetical protein [Methylomonas sp. ZR1]
MTHTSNIWLQPITDIELLEALSKFNLPTQSAITLTVVTDIKPSEIIDLTWFKLKSKPINKKAIKLLSAMPRHIFSDLVFWETVNGGVEPLRSFENNLALFLNGKTLAEFNSLYRNMIYIQESSTQFMRDVNDNIFFTLL